MKQAFFSLERDGEESNAWLLSGTACDRRGVQGGVMLSKLTRYLKAEISIENSEDLREGPAKLTGVGVRTIEPLTSPFRGKKCLAYVYRVLRVVQTRGGSMPSVVRERVCQVPIEVELPDGTSVLATPKKADALVTPEEHRQMISAGEEGVYFDENLVDIGSQVRVTGMVSKVGDDWRMTFTSLENLGAPPESKRKGPVRGRKRRKS